MCTWGLGPDLWIRMSLTHFADLTDVTLADDVNRAVHYRLSSIKGVQFRFTNFVSHFIRIQIFQIDFPLILYL